MRPPKKTTSPVSATDAARLSRDSFSDAVLGHLIAAPEIDETLRLAGIRRHQLRRLMGDDEIGAALDTRRAAVQSTPWRIDGYDDSPPMQHLSQTLTRHMDAIVGAVWDAVPMGYSVAEAVWSPASGTATVDLQRIHRVPMQHFTPQLDGSLRGNLPGVGYEQTLDNTFKFFDTVREPSIEAPNGVALLAPLYWPWHFRQHGWRYWMQFMERFGMPIVAGQTNDPTAFVNAMSGLGINTAIGVGTQDTVSIVSQTVAGEFERLEQALCKRIQKLILGQTLTSDVGKTGSYAAAHVHDLVRQDRKAADLKLVCATIQRIVNAFWALNRYPSAAPIFLMEDSKGIEADRAVRDAELVKAGVITLTEQYLLTHYDFEPGDFSIPQGPGAQAEGDTGNDTGNDAGNMAARTPLRLSAGRTKSERFTPGQQMVEALCDLAIADAPAIVNPQALKAAIQTATSPDDLAEKIGTLMAQHPASAFAAIIDKALYAADVLGWANAEQRRY